MVEITADLVRMLREKTGAGMMDCKKALVESSGDMDLAVDWLRKKGLSAASKKASRVAAEGLIGIAVDGNRVAMVEVNTETDFVAKNPQFQEFVSSIARVALSAPVDVDALSSQMLDGSTVGQTLTHLIATIGEHMTIRRFYHSAIAGGFVSTYMHNAEAAGLGKVGVVVVLSVDNQALGKQLAMHIAASAPVCLSVADLDPALVTHERDIQREMALQSGKPAEIVEKMLDGRIRKFYEEVCLLEQAFVLDPDKKVSSVLAENSIQILAFARFALGEGIEKQAVNFAEEVAKVIQ